MTGWQSKKMSSADRHADPMTVDHIIALRKERDEALMHSTKLLADADYWRGKCLEWMDRCYELQTELSNVRKTSERF